MLDSKTLKPGDVVVFGGKLDRTVKFVSPLDRADAYVFFDEDRNDDWYSITDPIWQIAELKKRDLPKVLHFFTLDAGRIYKVEAPFGDYDAESLLLWLKRDVAKLEAAGVKEKA